MSTDPSIYPNPEETSRYIDPSFYNTCGFSSGFELRRHKHEHLANEGSRQCRSDWLRCVGPVNKFGNCNPYSGHFGALVVPLCKPERLRVIAYVFEYAFIYDEHLESAGKAIFSSQSQNAGLDEVELRTLRSDMGTKQLQSKMLLGLMEIDEVCAKVVIDAWKTMVATTARLDKGRIFEDLEEYVEYRIVDTGAPFVDTLMRFGMEMVLTEEEESLVRPMAHECFVALGLANDYFSFDVEWQEFQKSSETTLTNAVWLFMHWHDADVEAAKAMVKDVTNRYENNFKQMKKQFAHKYPDARKLNRYLDGLAYQVSGNVAWSLTCPRYHPEKRYDPNIGADMPDLPIIIEAKERNVTPKSSKAKTQHRRVPSSGSDADSRRSSTSSTASSLSTVSSISSSGITNHRKPSPGSAHIAPSLTSEHVTAPFDYITSLPSKGVRDTLIDSLNVWTKIPRDKVSQIKSVINVFHSASLMFDDIQDCSPLRRGKPATHMVYGQAQTINSASYHIVSAISEAAKLNPSCVQVLVDGLKDMHVGQSWELYWTESGTCHSEDEYLEMVDKKTGGLFQLANDLLVACSERKPTRDLGPLLKQLGRYFQIRDDYQNIADADYTQSKGFCEDLDEGKFSYPIVRALGSGREGLKIKTLMQQGRHQGGLSREQKMLVLEDLEKAKALDTTTCTLKTLGKEIKTCLMRTESDTGVLNWVLRLLIHRLKL